MLDAYHPAQDTQRRQNARCCMRWMRTSALPTFRKVWGRVATLDALVVRSAYSVFYSPMLALALAGAFSSLHCHDAACSARRQLQELSTKCSCLMDGEHAFHQMLLQLVDFMAYSPLCSVLIGSRNAIPVSPRSALGLQGGQRHQSRHQALDIFWVECCMLIRQANLKPG